MELTAAEVLYEAKATENMVWKLIFTLSILMFNSIQYFFKFVLYYFVVYLREAFFCNNCSLEKLLQIKDSGTFQQKVGLRKWTVNQMIFYYDQR